MSISMAYSMPYASQGFCDPITMVQFPHGRESMSSRFNFGASSAVWEAPQDPTKPFNLQYMANINLSIPGLYGPSLTYGTGTQMSAPAPPPVPSVQSSSYYTSPSVFLQPGESPFASQPNPHIAYTMAAMAGTPNPFPSTSSAPFSEEDRIVPVCHRDHAKQRSATVSPTDRLSPSRVYKRHSPYPCANHSSAAPPVSDPIPPSRKRPSSSRYPSPTPTTPKPKKPRTCAPLPDTLQPIRIPPVSGALPRCPMPQCGAEIEACDAAWRGHFKAMHHDDLCLTPGCAGPPSPDCKARCPCPLPLADDGGPGKACGRGTMAVESVGRHLLNVHFGVAYRCPLCGVERRWRESACARHVRLCLKKQKGGSPKKWGGH